VGSGAKPLPTVRLVQKIVFFGGIVASVRAIVEDQTLVAIQIRDPYRSTPLFTHTPTHTHTHTVAGTPRHPASDTVGRRHVISHALVCDKLCRTHGYYFVHYVPRGDGVPQGVGQSVTSPNCPRVTVQVFAYIL